MRHTPNTGSSSIVSESCPTAPSPSSHTTPAREAMPPAVAPGRLRPPASFRPDPLTADQGRGAPRLQGRPGCPESVSCYPATVAIETLAHARPGSTPDPGPIAATWLG